MALFSLYPQMEYLVFTEQLLVCVNCIVCDDPPPPLAEGNKMPITELTPQMNIYFNILL